MSLPSIRSVLGIVEPPLPGFNFYVDFDAPNVTTLQALQIAAMAAGGFAEAKGLGAELEVMAYPEGGVNDFVHQLPVRHSWGRITLRRGVVRDLALWSWYEAGLTGSLGARRNGAITLCDERGLPAMRWAFRDGLAAKWFGPELNAATGAVAIDGIEIVHQGLELQPGAGIAGAVIGLAGIAG